MQTTLALPGIDPMKKLIAYYRVSTQKQGKSGLGLEAQKDCVETYAGQHEGRIVAEYREVESGRNPDRPELLKALAHAKRSRATLFVAKLDRLSRNVAFLSALMESEVDFVCCDNPHATKFTIHILAAVAEDESRKASIRTREALQALKARGKKLGSHRPGHWKGREQQRLEGAHKGGQRAAAKHRKAANEAYTDLYPLLQELRAKGNTFQEIADRLNADGHTTRRGKAWNAVQIMRVLNRASQVKL